MAMKVTALVLALSSALASASSNSSAAAAAANSSVAASAVDAFACVPKQENPNCGTEGNMLCCPVKGLHSSPHLIGNPKRSPNWKPEDLPKLCPERCRQFELDSECLIPCLEGLPTWEFREPKYKDHYPCIPIDRTVDCTKRSPKWCCRDHVYQRDVSHVEGVASIPYVE